MTTRTLLSLRLFPKGSAAITVIRGGAGGSASNSTIFKRRRRNNGDGFSSSRARCLTTTSSSKDNIDNNIRIQGVQRGMERWIKELIIAEKICPFAAGSSYQFQIYPHDHFSETSTISFFQQQVIKTGQAQAQAQAAASAAAAQQENHHHNLNTFVVFPFVQEFQIGGRNYMGTELFFHFYMAAVQNCNGLALTPEMDISSSEYKDDHPQKDQKVVAMPFHPDWPKWSMIKQQQQQQQQQSSMLSAEDDASMPIIMPTEERYYSTCSPFPAIHLLRRNDLQKARGGSTSTTSSQSVSRIISERNSITLPTLGLSELQKRINDYKKELPPVVVAKEDDYGYDDDDDDEEASYNYKIPATTTNLPFLKKPSILQVIEPPSPERLKQLEEQGITVQVVKVTDNSKKKPSRTAENNNDAAAKFKEVVTLGGGSNNKTTKKKKSKKKKKGKKK